MGADVHTGLQNAFGASPPPLPLAFLVRQSRDGYRAHEREPQVAASFVTAGTY